MRKYRIYVGAGVLIFALVLSYFAYHRIRCTNYLQNPGGSEETVSISVLDYVHDTNRNNIRETDTFWKLLSQCEYDGIAKEPKSGGIDQPFVVFMINGKADHVMTYEEDWTIVNKKDTIFKYIFWERLDYLPIPECCFHFIWCQIA